MKDFKEIVKNKILVAGHRGNSSEYAENSLEAFVSAVISGINIIEVDIQWTKDGVIVCLHDEIIFNEKREEKIVSDINFDELLQYQNVNTLTEIVSELKDKTYFIIEIKPQYSINNEQYLYEIYKLAKDMNILHQSVFISYYLDNLIYLKKNYNNIYTAAIISDIGIDLCKLKSETSCDAIICHINDIHSGIDLDLAVNDLFLGVFGIESPEDIEFCIKHNVDIMGTDHPKKVLTYLKQYINEK